MQSSDNHFAGKWILFVGMVLLMLFASAILASGKTLNQTAAEGQDLFKQKCSACHTIGAGKLIGPDLQGVTQRRDLDWLQRMISGPDKLLAAQDPVLTPLVAEYNNFLMPNLGLTQTQVQAVIAYLENPGSVGQAQPVALPNSGDQGRGRQYFRGALRLANGGPNCIACHSTADLPALGGGSLGPDLTQVAQRLGDQGLASALQTLPFPTMQGIFANRMLTPAEQADLYAYFQSVKMMQPARENPQVWFWGIGVAGSLVLFGVLRFYWPRQRRSLAERLRGQA
jgi:mono/diheme cytochrome c family protein